MICNARLHDALWLMVSVLLLAVPADLCNATDHLVISEVVLAPDAGEFIEIYNPTDQTVDLITYYLTNNSKYWRVPAGGVGIESGDFTVRFPAGATIEPFGVIIIALNAANFQNVYGFLPDYEIPPQTVFNGPFMLPAYEWAVSSSANLANSGEGIVLFYWDGINDLVRDVDIVRVGMPTPANDIAPKTGLSLDGFDPGNEPSTYLPDAMTMPVMLNRAPAGFSHKRLALEVGEIAEGGNGLLGHDETTEDISITWDGSGIAFTPPTPGVVDLLDAPICRGDIAPPKGNGIVNVDDLLTVISTWGPCEDGALCVADIAPPEGNGVVNVDDLLAVISAWGECLSR